MDPELLPGSEINVPDPANKERADFWHAHDFWEQKSQNVNENKKVQNIN